MERSTSRSCRYVIGCAACTREPHARAPRARRSLQPRPLRPMPNGESHADCLPHQPRPLRPMPRWWAVPDPCDGEAHAESHADCLPHQPRWWAVHGPRDGGSRLPTDVLSACNCPPRRVLTHNTLPISLSLSPQVGRLATDVLAALPETAQLITRPAKLLELTPLQALRDGGLLDPNTGLAFARSLVRP